MVRTLLLRAGAILAVATGLTSCSPLAALNGVLVPRDGWTAHRDIPYGADARNRLDVYVPKGGVENAPVVVFFYGGAWRSGTRGLYRFVGEALTSRGFVAVIPDYRLYPDVRFPAFVEDGAAAVRWVQDHIAAYGGDPDRIVLAGHSAGAHIAALLATDRRYLDQAGVAPGGVRGLIGLAGPYAIDPANYEITRAVFEGAQAAQTQPVAFADASDPPMLLLHGTDDSTVRPENSDILAQRVRAAGGAAETIDYADTGHIGIVLAIAAPFRRPGGVFDAMAGFLTRVTAHPAPQATGGGGPR